MKLQSRLFAILPILSFVLFANVTVIARHTAAASPRQGVTQLSASCHTAGRKHRPPLALHSRGIPMCRLSSEEARSRFFEILSDILFSDALPGLIRGVVDGMTTRDPDKISNNAALMLGQEINHIRTGYRELGPSAGKVNRDVDSMWAARPLHLMEHGEGQIDRRWMEIVMNRLCYTKPGWQGQSGRPLKTADVLRDQFTGLPSLLKDILAENADTQSLLEHIHDKSTFFLVALEALCSRKYPGYTEKSPEQELVHFFGSIFSSNNLHDLLATVTRIYIPPGPQHASHKLIQDDAVEVKRHLEEIRRILATPLEESHSAHGAPARANENHVEMWYSPPPYPNGGNDRQLSSYFLLASKGLCVPHPSWQADGSIMSTTKKYMVVVLNDILDSGRLTALLEVVHESMEGRFNLIHDESTSFTDKLQTLCHRIGVHEPEHA